MGKVVEGALLGGTLLPEKEFKELLSSLLDNQDYEKQFVLLIDRAIKKTLANDITGLYTEIETLQTQMFMNPETSLLLITNLKSPTGDYQWSWQHSEKNTLTDKGGSIKYIEAIKEAIIEQERTEALSQHLKNMLNMVESTKMSTDDYNLLFHSGIYNFGKHSKKSEIGKRAAEKNSAEAKTISYIFYGNKDIPYRRGQIADAFLNHVGNMHRAVLGDFTFTKAIPHFPINVDVEEGINFYQVLLDSANNAGWQTGGDLILLDGNEIIANVQLKTIQDTKEDYVGHISSKKILEKLIELKDYTEKKQIYNKEVFVNKCYDLFSTSGIMTDVKNKIMEIPIEYAKKNLSKMNFKNVKITFS